MEELITTAETAVEEKPSLLQLIVEVKVFLFQKDFYLAQAAQSIIEVGKRLIAAKELVPHGEWKNWLDGNFSLSQNIAGRYMQAAKRFSNSATSQNLNKSQITEMLALPEGEEEQFINAKAAEGKPVEDMTVKTLRAEIADYKAQLEDNESKHAAEIERLEKIRASLIDTLNGTRKNIDKVIIEKNQLERQLKEKEKPEVVTVEIEKEIVPADYESTKAEVTELNKKLLASKDKIAESAEKLAQVQNVTNELKKALADKSAELEKYQANYDDAQSQLDKASKEIKKLKSIIKAKDDISSQTLNQKQVACLRIGNGIGYQPAEPYKLLLTDPPYSTEVENIDDFAESWLPNALNHVRDDGFAYVFIGAYPAELKAYLNVNIPAHINLVQVLIWTYRNTLGNNPKDRYKLNYQACLFYRGVNAPALDCPLTSEQWAVQDINAPDGRLGDRYHTWQKPLEIAERFIRHSTKAGDTVFDPFACSGTFLLAAAKLGRKAIGFEINPDNAKIAFERGCRNGW